MPPVDRKQRKRAELPQHPCQAQQRPPGRDPDGHVVQLAVQLFQVGLAQLRALRIAHRVRVHAELTRNLDGLHALRDATKDFLVDGLQFLQVDHEAIIP